MHGAGISSAHAQLERDNHALSVMDAFRAVPCGPHMTAYSVWDNAVKRVELIGMLCDLFFFLSFFTNYFVFWVYLPIFPCRISLKKAPLEGDNYGNANLVPPTKFRINRRNCCTILLTVIFTHKKVFFNENIKDICPTWLASQYLCVYIYPLLIIVD